MQSMDTGTTVTNGTDNGMVIANYGDKVMVAWDDNSMQRMSVSRLKVVNTQGMVH